ncbi:hypothetical protein ACUJ40_03575 [Halococcus saccharolyticus]
MVQLCERCDRLFERNPEGGACTTTTNGTIPCFRTEIRYLDRGNGGGSE